MKKAEEQYKSLEQNVAGRRVIIQIAMRITYPFTVGISLDMVPKRGKMIEEESSLIIKYEKDYKRSK